MKYRDFKPSQKIQAKIHVRQMSSVRYVWLWSRRDQEIHDLIEENRVEETSLGAITAYLINRVPSKILAYKTPYEKVYGEKLGYDNLRVFGSLAYATDLRITYKFHPRTIPCVFLGYPNNQKGFILLNLRTRDILVSRHVILCEDWFPFREFERSKQGEWTNKRLITPS